MEWAAAAHLDVSDPATWPSFMPALGRTIDAATVAADMASMRPSECQAGVSANLWPDETDEGWAVIPR